MLNRRALISDVHANLEALEAVLRDIRQQDVEEIYCLGDTVGYGPNPRECLDLVLKECRVVLKGKSDQALFEAFETGPLSIDDDIWITSELMDDWNWREGMHPRFKQLIDLWPRYELEERVIIEYSAD